MQAINNWHRFISSTDYINVEYNKELQHLFRIQN